VLNIVLRAVACVHSVSQDALLIAAGTSVDSVTQARLTIPVAVDSETLLRVIATSRTGSGSSIAVAYPLPQPGGGRDPRLQPGSLGSQAMQ
jgi:hypothetical protein